MTELYAGHIARLGAEGQGTSTRPTQLRMPRHGGVEMQLRQIAAQHHSVAALQ